MVSLNRVFCCFYKNKPESVKIILKPELEKRILEKTRKIIGDQSFDCPPALKRQLIKKYNYEPGRLRKIISKMSKPAAKIIATFAVASILTPIACAYIIPSSIPVLPGLIVLGSEYWASVSVSLVSLAVYPLITAAFGAVFNGVSSVWLFVAKRAHAIGRKLGIIKAQNLNEGATYRNFMSEIHYDPESRRFYKLRGNERTDLRESYVLRYIERSLKLEKIEMLLRGRKEEIEHQLVRKDVQVVSKLDDMIGSISTISDLPTPTNDDQKQILKEIKASQALRQLINNDSYQDSWKAILKYHLKEKVKEEAERLLDELKNQQLAAQSSSSI